MNKRNLISILLFSVCLFAVKPVIADVPKNHSVLSFKENKGQIGDQFSKPRPDILFSGNSGNLVFHLRENGVSYQLQRIDSWREIEEQIVPGLEAKIKKVPSQSTVYRIDMDWLNVNLDADIERGSSVGGYENYYSEVCPQGVKNVRSYLNVTYKNLYNGIHLKWYEKDGNLKYEYIVSPGSDYRQIKIKINGAEDLFLDKSGNLVVQTPLGELMEKAPVVTQEGKTLSSKWKINKNVLSFEIAGQDPAKQLVIDPLVRLWGSYYGGNEEDEFDHSECDAAGNVYVTGNSSSLNNIATSGAYQAVLGNGIADAWMDAILVKFDSAGNRLWATYYGGAGDDYARECTIDASGNNIAIIGNTSSAGIFSTPGAFQPNYLGRGDVFVALFDATGQRQWGTYYGGTRYEWGWGCDFDAIGNIYIAGTTTSTLGFSSPGAHQISYGGGDRDGFIAKFDFNGNRLWATYFGGEAWDYLTDCTCDADGNIVVTGCTDSKTSISTPGSCIPVLISLYHKADGLVAKFNSSGTRLWGTYFGGNGDDYTWNSVYDKSGNIYVAGVSNGAHPPDIVTAGAYQTVYGGGSWDGFLLKMDGNGQRLWCTFYGDSLTENNNWCTADPTGHVYLVGCTTSMNHLASSCAYQSMYGGDYWGYLDAADGGDAFITKFDSLGNRLWGTYYGGSGLEFNYVTSCTDASGNLFLVGITSSTDGAIMASPGSYQTVFGGGKSDAFIAEFNGCIPYAENISDPSAMNVCKGQATVLTVSPSCNTWYDAPLGGNAIGSGSVYTTSSLSGNSTFYINDESCGSTTVRTAITVTVNPLPQVSINTPSIMLCYKSSVNLKASGANSYSWFPSAGLSCDTCPEPVASPAESMQYCVRGIGANSCVATACSTLEVNLASEHDFSLPNAFTPDGDGLNDSFCLQGWDLCNESFNVMIFDRWGEKVFESDDPGFCWNGIYKGQLLSSDNYVYAITAKYKDGTVINKKGNILMIR